MKEKKRKVFEEYQTLFKHAVIDARENNHTVIPEPEIHFTPGVPTEDGWYVCKVKRYDLTESYETYMAIEVTKSGILAGVGFNVDILSHAKLPEL